MSLDKSMQSMKFDSRLIEINLRNGTLTKEELQKHLAQLPDSAGNSEKIDLEEGNGHDRTEHH